MKRILMITTEFPPVMGGIGTYCYQLATAAAKRGHEVTVFAPDYHRPAEELSGDSALPFRVIRYDGGSYTIRDFARYLGQVWGVLKSADYDVVHAADWPSALMMRNVNRFKRVPYQLMVHGTEVLLAPESRQIRLLGRGLFTMPRRITTNSQFTRDLLLKNFPQVDPGKVDVTLLGVGPEWFEPVASAAETLARFHIAQDRFCLLTVARFDERKGHRLVLQALSELPATVTAHLTYVIAGGGGDAAYAEELRSLAASSPVPVVFTGRLDDSQLKALYSRADVFVMPGTEHPRRVEGFGLAYLEAAAQGVPAIASSVGAVPEVVVDGETGLIIAPGDADALARDIVRLYEDRELLGRLGTQARERAATFTWDRCAAETYEAE